MDFPITPQLSGGEAPRPGVSDVAWNGYLNNLGLWTGKRALTNPRGKVLIDLPSRVTAQQFRTRDDDVFVLWRTAVRTADGVEQGDDDEWSRDELTDFGALGADGSFSVGAQVFVGEAITIDQCVHDGEWRVRSTHAFDWEGCLSGVIANRERLVSRTVNVGDSDSNDNEMNISQQQRTFIEPVAWRNPRVLFDYLQGVWEGRGICIDARTGSIYQLTSRVRFGQGATSLVTTSSVLRIGDDGPTRVFEASGHIDANYILFAEANIQMLLLPGGVYVSSPVRIRPGKPFTVETAFLMKPDCRKRILRAYNRDAEWINTTFLNERRSG